MLWYFITIIFVNIWYSSSLKLKKSLSSNFWVPNMESLHKVQLLFKTKILLNWPPYFSLLTCVLFGLPLVAFPFWLVWYWFCWSCLFRSSSRTSLIYNFLNITNTFICTYKKSAWDSFSNFQCLKKCDWILKFSEN